MQWITHGSIDSLDQDLYILCTQIPEAKWIKPIEKAVHELLKVLQTGSIKELETLNIEKRVCEYLGLPENFTQSPDPEQWQQAQRVLSKKPLNPSLIVLHESVVWAQKGTRDEVQNSIWATHDWHDQLPSVKEHIQSLDIVPRIVELKWLRVMRGLLSTFSRTPQRSIIKEALTGTWDKKLESLEQLNRIGLSQLVALGQSGGLKEASEQVAKFCSFQLISAIALGNGVEIFSKQGALEYVKTLGFNQEICQSVQQMLMRKASDYKALDTLLTHWIKQINESMEPVKGLWVLKGKSTFGAQNQFVFNKELGTIKNSHASQSVNVYNEKICANQVAVFDLDDTLAQSDERKKKHNKLDSNKAWEAFFLDCQMDTCNPLIHDCLKVCRQQGWQIVIATGRSQICEKQTLAWLAEHDISYDYLFMRSRDNRIPAVNLKYDWLKKMNIKRIEVVFDDETKIIEGFRSKGLRVVDPKNTQEVEQWLTGYKNKANPLKC